MSGPDPIARPAGLGVVQRWFETVITHPEGAEAGLGSADARHLIDLGPGALETVITRSRALTAAERLAIYANAYHTRLLECLGEVFPMLKRMLGEEAFNDLAFDYLQVYPSKSYTLNELGRHFPQYLRETRPADDTDDADDVGRAEESDAGEPGAMLMPGWGDLLIELARLEWAIYQVFDGPGVEDQPLLQVGDLAIIPPEDWPRVQLRPVPCLQLLATRFPVNEYFTALRHAEEEQVVPIPEPIDSYVALTRRDYIVRRYELSALEHGLLSALMRGESIGDAVAAAAWDPDGDAEEIAGRLRLWFRNWTAEGFFQSVVVPG